MIQDKGHADQKPRGEAILAAIVGTRYHLQAYRLCDSCHAYPMGSSGRGWNWLPTPAQYSQSVSFSHHQTVSRQPQGLQIGAVCPD